ncbi:hypothetical protein EHP00_2124 [Ecytonucleospora hepatopenaei]|uniref:Secreted protein n=1 Tax=Ecytonucleospora hepatopenaei TaxID=646526 RepID=A0A1W0E3Z6_9MICR|nr:hypothetical protein EHP00_2124 [Ecytonucleospora hepatopenaei]
MLGCMMLRCISISLRMLRTCALSLTLDRGMIFTAQTNPSLLCMADHTCPNIPIPSASPSSKSSMVVKELLILILY